jgi:glycine hydroxymethyltransferase
MMLVDLRPKGVTARDTERALERPAHHLQQERHPLRPAAADRDLGHPPRLAPPAPPAASATEEFRAIGEMIVEVVDGLAASGPEGNAGVEATVKTRVKALCKRFPIYPGL